MRAYLFILFLFFSPLAFAQQANPLPRVQQKMQALNWLNGKWHGTAYVYGQDGKKQRFEHNLEFSNRLNNTVLLINENSIYDQDTVAQNIGFLGYNVLQSRYNLEAFTKEGEQLEAYVEVFDEKMIWRYHVPGRIIRYTADLNKKGQWHQIGEISTDEGNAWTLFLESTLTRIK